MTNILINFLKSGSLGKLHLNQHIDDVLEYLGPPNGSPKLQFDSINDFKKFAPEYKRRSDTNNPEVDSIMLRYGLLQIQILSKSDRVVFFKILFDEYGGEIPPIINDGSILSIRFISTDDLKAFLVKNELSAKRVLTQMDEFVTYIWFPSSGVEINIDIEDSNDQLMVVSQSGYPNETKDKCKYVECEDFISL